MNDGEMQSSQMNDDNYQPMSNARQLTNSQTRSNAPDGGVGTRVIRNPNDWKWGKQVIIIFKYNLSPFCVFIFLFAGWWGRTFRHCAKL